MESSAVSVESIQPVESWIVRTYCSLAPMLDRRPIACDALNGSSAGRVISLLEAALACVLASCVERELRSARTLRWTMEVVMRMAKDRPFRCG